MKILSRRAMVAALFLLLFAVGIAGFLITYLRDAPAWVRYPANRHLYTAGQLKAGTVYDRSGAVLAQTVNNTRVYNGNADVRTALMQTVGDSNGDIATGAQVAFASQLTGWSLLNGTYRTSRTVSDIHLTVDANLCVTAYKALAGRKGAVGVYNYKTGEILCIASSPSFDPENPPSAAAVKADAAQYEGVYMNKFFSAAYTPGSVFKLVTSAAAVDTIPGATTKSYYCDGTLDAGGGKVTCPRAHGTQTLSQALSHSCNVTFGGLALQLGGATLQKYADLAGFNSALSVDGIRTAAGHVDVTGAKGANLAWSGVGQYTDTANPLNYLAYVGAIANGGVRVTPHILQGSASAQQTILSASTADTVKSMMRYAVLHNYGEYNYRGLQLCAKSGTAQLADGTSPHAWFVGFMDRQDCPLAFVVVIENGGAGSSQAGPVAGKVLQAALRLYVK